MSYKLTFHSNLGAYVYGNAYWLGDTEESGNAGYSISKPITISIGSGGYVYRNRALFRFDLSELPKFAVIKKAILKPNGTGNKFYYDDLPSGTREDLYIYIANLKPWTKNLTFTTYDGVHNWEKPLLFPDYDFQVYPHTALNIPVGNGDTFSDDIDVTELVQEMMFSDTYTRIDFFFKVSDDFENTVVGGSGSSISLKYSILEVEYELPIAFYGSTNTGDIDYTRSYGAGAGNSFKAGAITIGRTGTAKKVWVKNLTEFDFVNLKIYSRKSYASKQFEMIYATSYDDKSWDISTTDKSEDNSNYTRNSWYKIVFTSSNLFDVYRSDKSTNIFSEVDDFTKISSGNNIGSTFTDTERGVSFTLPTPTTSPTANEYISFQTFEDDAVIGSPADSEDCFEIAFDNSGSPSAFLPLKKGKSKVQSVISGTQYQLYSVDDFYVGATVRFFNRNDGTYQQATISSIDTATTSITVYTSLTGINVDDYVDVIPEIYGDLFASQEKAIWVRTVGNTTKEERKIALIRAEVG